MKKKNAKKSLIFPLKWNLNFDLTELLEAINNIALKIKELIRDYPHEKERREYKKLKKWDDQLVEILGKVQEIQKYSIQTIEQTLNIKFRDHNLLVIAFFTRTTKNLFLEMKQESSFNSNYPDVFNTHILDRLINLGDLAEGFATLGDAVLGLVAVHRAWDKGLIKKKSITDEKIELERNSKLAQICVDLKLDDYQISVVPESKNISQDTMNHKKATFFEALIWVYYSENGLESVLSLLNRI